VPVVSKDSVCMCVCELLHVADGEPARVYMWTSQRLAELGQDAQLYCRASGSPRPTITWYDPDEQEISPDDDDGRYKVIGLTTDYFLLNKRMVKHTQCHVVSTGRT